MRVAAEIISSASVPGPPSLTILDVGHGSSCVITDGTVTVVVDTGPGVGLLEYLLDEGIRRVDSVVLSHADADHIRGLIALLGAAEFEVHQIVANSDALKASTMWSNLAWDIDNLKRRGILESEHQIVEGDDLPTQVPGCHISALAPRVGIVMTGPGAKDLQGRVITSNSASAVLLVQVGSRRVALLTGDMDELGFDHLQETGQDLTADLLIFPHHGGLAGGTAASAGRFAERLTSAVGPRDVIFSLDRRRYGTPRPEIIAGVLRAKPDVRIACTQLSESCAAELPSSLATHLLPLYASGREQNSCCAGTMRAMLTEDDSLMPSYQAHATFIGQIASTALCRRGLPGVI